VKKKKKPFRQAPGINSIALQEAQEIFGDVSSLLEERRKHMMTGAAGLDDELRDEEKDEDDYGHGQRAPPQKLLEKQFEPSLLEEKFLTEKDDRLRETDVPERLQVCNQQNLLIYSIQIYCVFLVSKIGRCLQCRWNKNLGVHLKGLLGSFLNWMSLSCPMLVDSGRGSRCIP
jgi:hypothetical protein